MSGRHRDRRRQTEEMGRATLTAVQGGSSQGAPRATLHTQRRVAVPSPHPSLSLTHPQNTWITCGALRSLGTGPVRFIQLFGGPPLRRDRLGPTSGLRNFAPKELRLP